ncbi:MAG TPA: HAD family hydrolase [Acidobacteriota bacterium]|nr:HAD family hydrolase [Acidobacteriota bacterium]
MKRRAVFLDRDGTINEDVGYPGRYGQVRIYPYSFEAVRKLNAAGLAVVVITNQSGVGRGFFTEDELRVIHDRMRADFAAAGARIDAVYYCPHFMGSSSPAYDIDCACRKPFPGMALRAREELDLDLEGSYMVGDKVEDVRFGLNAGARPVLVLTGFGEASREALLREGIEPAHVAPDVGAAADWILARERERADGTERR